MQIFDKYGKVGKVTIIKDRHTRQSKGVAFVLFVDRSSAQRAIHALHGKELFSRTLKVCIAADNGRTTEFIKRRIYKDKSRCYECGEFGHLSYKCPMNALGDREEPMKKPKKERKKKVEKGGAYGSGCGGELEEEEEEEEEELDNFSLGDAIRCVFSCCIVGRGLLSILYVISCVCLSEQLSWWLGLK